MLKVRLKYLRSARRWRPCARRSRNIFRGITALLLGMRFLQIEGEMRRQRKQDLYRKEEFKRAVIEWTLGIIIATSAAACCNFYTGLLLG